MWPLILTWVARVRLNDAHNSGYSKVQPRVQVVNDPLCGIRPQVINWEGASYKGCTSLFRDRGVLIFCSNYKFHWSLFINIKSSQSVKSCLFSKIHLREFPDCDNRWDKWASREEKFGILTWLLLSGKQKGDRWVRCWLWHFPLAGEVN